MGGGDSSSNQISVDSQGMAYPTTTGGFDYSALGQALSKGLGQFGSALENQKVPNYMTNTPNMPQSTISAVSPQTSVIPYSGMLGASVPYPQHDAGSMQALMRLLQGLS